VVGEQLGVVDEARTGEAFDPLTGGLMAADPLRPGDLSIGHIPHEGVPERIFLLAVHARDQGRSDQLGALESAQLGAHRVPVEAGHGRQRPGPEDLADHGGVLEQRLAPAGKGVQPGRDERLHGGWEGKVGPRCTPQLVVRGQQPSVGEQADILLGVQGVAVRAFQQRRLNLSRQPRPAEQGPDQPSRVARLQGSEGDHRGALGVLRPAGMPLVQFGPRGSDHQQGHAAHGAHKVLEEGEQGVVGPVQILYHQDQRAAGGHGFKKAAPCGELLGLLSRRRGAAEQPEQRSQSHLQPFALILVGDEGRDGRLEFDRDHRRVIRLQHTGLCLDDLPQRPEGHTLAVGQAVALAPDHQLGLIIDEPQQFPDEPALADPGLTDEGD
jgi:hypothetical protein